MKKLQSYWSVLLAPIILVKLISLSGCTWDDCAFKSEPELSVVFENTRTFIEVYAIKQDLDVIYSNTSQLVYILPVNMNNTESVYIFRGDQRTDTLEINYNFDVTLESKRCGFTGEVNELSIGNSTTFASLILEDGTIRIQ
ncbi:MAG: hypothetical protein AAGG59_12590 [Bacteroidota bacterium]